MSVRLTVADRIGTIRLDRPPAHALDREHQKALRDAAQAASTAPEVRAVLICGTEGAFSAGADIREMANLSALEMSAHAPVLQETFMSVAEIPKPVCAAIEGYALGGGLELALAADFRVCAHGARLGLPEITLGVIPGAGGTQRLTRLVGPAWAKRLILSGNPLTSEEAARLGLVDAVAAPGAVAAAARDLLAPFLDGPAAALAAAKRAIDGFGEMAGFRLETHLFASLFGTPDQAEGMAAFLEKRAPRFDRATG